MTIIKRPSKTKSETIRVKPFDAYEVHGCREYEESGGRWTEQCDDSEAEFYTIYGHIPGEGVQAIGDFLTREFAEEVLFRIAPD